MAKGAKDEISFRSQPESERDRQLGDRNQTEREQAMVEAMAEAIRRADTSLFNEDYGAQALAAIEILREHGWEIIPDTLSDAAVSTLVEDMPYGSHLNVVTYLDKMWDMMIERSRVLWRMDRRFKHITDERSPGGF